MKRMIPILMTAAMLATSGLVMAHPPGGDDRKVERMAERLGLDDAQRDQVAAIFEDSREQKRSLGEAVHENRKALRAATRFEQYDAALVAELAAEQGALHAQRIELKAKSRNAFLSVLSAEQRQQLDELRESRGEHMKRKGKGHGKGKRMQRWQEQAEPEAG